MDNVAERIRALSSEQQKRLTEQLCPLSFGQERIWFLEALDPGGSTFNLPGAVRLRGRLDPDALQQALTEIVRRHETLRTCFVSIQEKPYQIIQSPSPQALPVEDLTGLPEIERDRAVADRISELARVPFDLENDRMIRSVLLRLDADHHVIIVVTHHIATDGWSLGVFNREVAALYEAYAAGKPSPLPGLPLQYTDFAAWQREFLESDAAQDQLLYWRRRLQDHPTALELPTDRPRRAVQNHQGAAVKTSIPSQLLHRLSRLARNEGCTHYMLLLASLALLLARHSGQRDLCIGSPIAGRENKELETLIGFFLNQLVMRMDLSGDPTFRLLLRQARQVALGAYANQTIPFEKLLEDLKPRRQLSRTPLFQVALNLQNYEASPITLTNLLLEPMRLPIEPDSKCDLTFYATTLGDQMQLRLVYDTQLFEADTARQLMGNLERLMAQAADEPDRRLSEFRLLGEADAAPRRARGVKPSSPAFRHFAEGELEKSITCRFQAQARAAPRALALQTRHRAWSYEELNRFANRIAHALPGSGVGTPDSQGEPPRVGLLHKKADLAIASMLGALKAGWAYVPLHPSHSPSRLAMMAKDARPAVWLTDAEQWDLARRLGGNPTPVVNVESLPADLPDHDPEDQPPPDTVAYILYTSGSTGEPKGVVQNHRNVLFHIRALTNNLAISAEDRLTLLPSIDFDAAVMDIYAALLNGASLFPMDVREESPSNLLRRIRDNKITVHHSTPTVFRYLFNGARRGDVSTVRAFVLGGEEARGGDLEIFRRVAGPDAVLVNGYGPSESTLALQSFFRHEDAVRRASLPIGFPVEGVEARLADDEGRDSEVFGEIVLKSRHVALGYWRRPEATATTFRAEAGADKTSYFTGDMARRLPDGSLEFLGRKDGLVKIGGLQVDLEDVRSVLREVPEIADCAVTVLGGEDDEPRLAAFVAPRPGSVVRPSQLRLRLRDRLPMHMVPSSFVPIPSIPVTPHGKIDVSLLPPVEEREVARSEEFVGPRNATEEMLADIWKQLLRVAEVGVHDNFFSLGGTSLLAVRLISRLRDARGVDLSLRAVFETPTIAGLAETVERTPAEESVPVLPMGREKTVTELLDELED